MYLQIVRETLVVNQQVQSVSILWNFDIVTDKFNTDKINMVI